MKITLGTDGQSYINGIVRTEFSLEVVGTGIQVYEIKINDNQWAEERVVFNDEDTN